MSATEVEIGVWVDGSQKWVSGVTRRTTCYDLIRALLRAQNLRASDADVMNYIIVERWKKVERPLDHEQRILKVWKSWGDTVHQVRFSLRRGRDDSPDADDNPKKKNKQSCDQDWDKNKENDAQLDGGSQDGAESSCGRSERSRRRHKMRQSRREATACLQKANILRVPPLQHHRPGADSPQPLSDESDSRDCGTRKPTKQEPRRPPRDDPRYNETMERLMRLVVAQGETIQNQLRRLNQRESQIESYEQQMHLLRVQSLGNDYLLSSYLHDQNHPPQEYPHVQRNPEQDGESGPRFSNHRNPLIPTARLQNSTQNHSHAPFNQSNKGLLPSMTDTREVHAKPINIVGDPNDLFIHDGGPSITASERINSMRPTKFPEHFKNNARFNKDDTICEEKSNDSGVVLGEECLTSVEDRSQRDIEDLNEAEVQERLTLFTKMENVLSRLLEEEEKIHGLRSTIEVIQTQQKREKTELEYDLKRAAEDHAALVAEVRSNEQQIRVVDMSAVQKRKLIDALLADEVDSDQETKYLQAKLDYILHLPPTAFRLPEEGDDPPPLPPPPAHPACLVQSLLHNQPPQLVHPMPVTSQHSSDMSLKSQHQEGKTQQPFQNYQSHYRSLSGDNRPSHGGVHRPPSPKVLYGNRAPSPSIMMGSNRAPSPVVRLSNRSCSPNRRKPLQPPPYDHHRLQNGDIPSDNNNSVPILRNSAISIKNTNFQSQVNNNKISNTTNTMKNTFVNMGVLPNKSDLRICNNRAINTSQKYLHLTSSGINEKNPSNQRSDIISPYSQGEENDSDLPPPLPLSPPPLLTSPASTSNLPFSKASRIQDNGNETETLDVQTSEASKRNLLSSIGSRIVSGHSNRTVDDDDNDSTTNNSSLGVSSRSSTSSETSISNSSSSVSSGICVDTYHSNNASKIQRIHNQTSTGISKPSKPSTLVPGANKTDSLHHRTNSLVQNESKKETDSGDSNSDTGLSSLHSSSDEAGYALDTLV